MTVVAAPDDERLLIALRRGDEAAFSALVEKYHGSLIRVAMSYVRERSVAEEVVQDTWLGLLEGLKRFEGRAQLKTWLFRILTNQAKTRAVRERRTVPFSSIAPRDDEEGGPAVEPERFLDASHPVWPGHWASPPRSWAAVPESRLLAKETQQLIADTIGSLPHAQSQVITLRDVEGWNADEVCALMEISDANQRVLLHRARSKVRAVLERHFE